MSEPSDAPTDATPATEPVEEVETAADLGREPAVVAEPVAADPVRTVSRRGAVLAMAACLLLGGLVGWVVADTTGGDDGGQLVSDVRDGRGEGSFFDGPRGPGPGGPGFPGGRRFPGGEWHHGERFDPEDGPRMDHDGPRDRDGDERGRTDR